jgi:hypothetical protein
MTKPHTDKEGKKKIKRIEPRNAFWPSRDTGWQTTGRGLDEMWQEAEHTDELAKLEMLKDKVNEIIDLLNQVK